MWYWSWSCSIKGHDGVIGLYAGYQVEEHSRNAFPAEAVCEGFQSSGTWVPLTCTDTGSASGKEKPFWMRRRGSFGIRRLQLDRVHGLRINGETVKLRGGCIHHDNGIIESAVFATCGGIPGEKAEGGGLYMWSEALTTP